MPHVSVRQYISTLFWMLFGKSRQYSTFIFGLSIGVLIGFAISAPILGWHLPDDASTVLSAFFGGVAGVAGAVVIWRLQDQAQRESVKHLVMVGLISLRASAETTANRLELASTPHTALIEIDVLMGADLRNFLATWSSLGIHQSAFNAFAFLELIAIKRNVESLLDDLRDFRMRVDAGLSISPMTSKTAYMQVLDLRKAITAAFNSIQLS